MKILLPLFSYVLLNFLLVFTTIQCQNQVGPSLDTEAPKFQKVDEQYADVFKPLDGIWKGEFLVFEDPSPVKAEEMELEELSINQIKRPELKETFRIEVQQVYASESPYFQRVTITDYYPETKKEVGSHGVNKVENGEMWCIVNKPEEQVVHQGKTRGDKTIIWYSSGPEKKEYFQETVDTEFYEIIGYGYYEGDDRALSPRLWFYAKYKRQD